VYGDALGRAGHVAEAVEVRPQRLGVRGVVLRVVGEDALELPARERGVVDAELLQLVQHDLAAHVVDRRDRATAPVAAQHAEHALGLAPRP